MSCTIQPYTDSYTYTVGYLLSWAIILEMCANAHGDLLYQYAEILKYICYLFSIEDSLSEILLILINIKVSILIYICVLGIIFFLIY